MTSMVPQLLTDRELARELRVSVDTIRRLRRRRLIGFVIVGGRPRFTAEHIAEYLSAQERKPCRQNDTKSEDTGLANVTTAQYGAAPGSIRTLDRRAAHHLALKALKRPRSGLRNGSH
ncbi:helix-turn-helix domain-containing protein [Acetobacter farinalis]|nr:helix-turn-helix domain-containing protein [Acetobacter farinalis]